ncbi:SAM-dependent methyltransferase [Sphingomonas sp. M1-B02]|uniref:SAM-dependent methyltransferase n=1 Tax=Sphingomonas sp. M1-B02 TaxID=3114300 RepID=UPI00223FF47F|nr:SAM-dependent methyltransferase [Sphingomonas sp. S6-11]UZK67705.1 SAM-dependent methyltransferase [Sphingomonas sp. S6-11]
MKTQRNTETPKRTKRGLSSVSPIPLVSILGRIEHGAAHGESPPQVPTLIPSPNYPQIPGVVAAEVIESPPQVRVMRGALNDNHAWDIQLDQYYTRQDVAADCYGIFGQHFDPALYLMVEPTAGTGSFYQLLPDGSLGFDVEPKYPGIKTADFLTVEIESDREIAVIGNPPFGKNASMAVRVFNRAARQASVIALILPRTFRKASIENRIDPAFHLLREETVPRDAFLFRSKPYDVPAVFQIWERRREPRALRLVETQHPDFEFTTSNHADFAIQRVGARAGRVHCDFTASPSSHYFIRGNVEAIMAMLDFASVVGNVAGNPSLSKSEIISLYRAYLAAPPLPRLD